LRLLHLLIPAALLVMLIGVACGGAEQTTDTDTGAGAADSSTGAAAADSTAGGTAAGSSDSGVAGATATPLPQAAPVSAAQSGEGRRLVVLTESFGNEVWDPKYEGGDKHLWHFPIHSHLITTSDDLKFTKDGLATDWRVSDDGLTMTWTIRDDAVFHNGDPVTADDAAWYQRYVLDDAARSVVRIRIWRLIAADEPNAAYEADNTDRLKEGHFSATGPNEMSVTFSQPTLNYFAATSESNGGTAGAVLSRSYWESLGDDDQSRSDAFIANPDPGMAGPFDLTAFNSGQQIVYTKRPDHFILALRPYPFDELEINLIAEAATRKAALLSGKADISPIDLDSREELEAAGLQYRFGPESTVIWINAWNCSVDAPQTLGYDQSRDQDAAGQYIGEPKGNPLMCQDKRIRHALDYAIDKEAIQELVGGPDVFHIAGSAAISPSGLGYRPNAGLDPFPFDPVKARDLFVEAGYNVPEAITPNGVTLEAVTNLKDPVYPGGGDEWNVWTWEAGATVPKMLQIVEFVCADWQTFLGLTCKVNVGEETAVKDKQYGGEIPGQYLVRSNEHSFDVGSKLVGRFADSAGAYISYDPLVEPLVDAALAATTPEDAAATYYAALVQAHEGHWDFAPGYLDAPYAVGTRIADWRPRPLRPSPSALWTIRWAQ
jgi:ABC-type transport system substrate-binding protein